MPSQVRRCDAAAVALDVPGDPGDVLPRSVVRYFDVGTNPPKSGRPTIDSTMTLEELIQRIARLHAAEESDIEWADPERD
ncbi:MAG: hypothetical protein Q9Q13_13520 [Acidobacteriota bacterium]|nr:hypothetical protein [Acidobacteriota bacterium]